VFSSCKQAADAAREIQKDMNGWFSDHRTIGVIQRDMFTPPCPGAVEYGSVAITSAIHYKP
jgi:hypothetical protein